MKEVYLLSGLGADKRVYDYIDLTGYKLNYLDWLDPVHNESIESYAKRLSVPITANKPTLIGVSFGGIVAIEIGKLLETEKVILISSAKTKFDIPFYYKIAGRLRLNRLIPAKFLKSTNKLTYWFFGVESKKEEDLLREIICDTDEKFLRWAIDKIVNWQNTIRLKQVFHIHGTTDRILPMNVADFKIINGGHLMILNKADEIGKVVRGLLS